MNLPKRLLVEQKLLDRYFPGFTIGGGTATGVLLSNARQAYGVRLDLGRFPLEMPRAYVTSPVLATRDGRSFASIQASGELHVLPADTRGNPQVCHWRPELWTPEHTLYQVVFKVRLWLEAYEAHRATGQPLDRFLPHA